jgi:hypothetical protein
MMFVAAVPRSALAAARFAFAEVMLATPLLANPRKGAGGRSRDAGTVAPDVTSAANSVANVRLESKFDELNVMS